MGFASSHGRCHIPGLLLEDLIANKIASWRPKTSPLSLHSIGRRIMSTVGRRFHMARHVFRQMGFHSPHVFLCHFPAAGIPISIALKEIGVTAPGLAKNHPGFGSSAVRFGAQLICCRDNQELGSRNRVLDRVCRQHYHSCHSQNWTQQRCRSQLQSVLSSYRSQAADEIRGYTPKDAKRQICSSHETEAEPGAVGRASPSKANRKAMRDIIKNAKAGLEFKIDSRLVSSRPSSLPKVTPAKTIDNGPDINRKTRVETTGRSGDRTSVKVTRLSKPNKKNERDKADLNLDSLVTAVLVGRPNVGKSALFNRLTKRREALVYDTPGGHVTRDHRQGVAKIGDLRLRILDTAGLEPSAEAESILGRTGKLTQNVLSKCHLALFLLDGRTGVHPRDFEVATWLRKVAPHVHVVVVVNKCEGLGGDPRGVLPAVLGEAHLLGWGEGVPLSAETGEGLSDLYERLEPLVEERKEWAGGSEGVAGCPSAEDSPLPLQLAICGRPNVGKSTLLNNLVGEERALTGPEPGLTRDSVTEKFRYKGREIALVDTAGWLQRSEQAAEGLAAMDAKRRLMKSHVVALVLDAGEILDARCTLKRSEMGLARWAVLEGRALVVIINKVDKLREEKWGVDTEALGRQMAKAVPEEIHAALPQVGHVPILFMSALTGDAQQSVMPVVEESYRNWCTRLSTAHLNKWLEKNKIVGRMGNKWDLRSRVQVLARSPRTSGHGGKIRYLTQVKARPPTFVAFTSGAGEVPETDMRFLAAALREDFKLPGIPVRVFQRCWH